jgi:molybdopterin synthase catalytic subunit
LIVTDDVRILTTTLDPAALTTELVNDRAHSQGALVTFVGMVRDLTANPVSAMQLEHYPGMTENPWPPSSAGRGHAGHWAGR